MQGYTQPEHHNLVYNNGGEMNILSLVIQVDRMNTQISERETNSIVKKFIC